MLRSFFVVTGSLLFAACAPESSKAPAKAAPRAETKPATPSAPDSPAPARAGAKTWTFDEATAGTIPPGIRPAETGSQGTPATWAVVADSTAPTGPNAFGITQSTNDKRTYNLALMEGTAYADVDLSVMVRSVSGQLNRGGGPIWRAQDPDNYYIARWDPVENNAYLYIMQSGVRSALAKTDLEIAPDAWHSLRVVMEGSHIELLIDDKPVLEADDTALAEPGMIGLWTKSDAATLFDDLSASKP